MAGCAVPDCIAGVVARGLCAKHYRRLLRHGDPNTVIAAGRPARAMLTSSLTRLRRAWKKATEEERATFLREVADGDPLPQA